MFRPLLVEPCAPEECSAHMTILLEAGQVGQCRRCGRRESPTNGKVLKTVVKPEERIGVRGPD